MSFIDDSRPEFRRDTSRDGRDGRRGRAATPLAIVSVIVAVVALILVFILRGCVDAGVSTACPTPTVTIVEVAADIDVPTAYEIWQIVGNDGTTTEFLSSLVGDLVAEIFVGSDGLAGEPGRSAYQLWLDAGNVGTPEQFLDSLKGLGGDDGAAGVSAYDLWILEGNSGTVNDFFDYLSGVDGAPGASAYDFWIADGNVGTVSEFLDSLVGAAGPTGAAGTCTVGETGATGASGAPGLPGLSAYQVWLAEGHVGSELVFLASLVGPSGSPGPTGAPGAPGAQGETGPQGEQGIPGTITGFGDSGSFWDLTIQGPAGGVSTATNTAYPMYFAEFDAVNNQGITVEPGAGDAPGRASYLTFTHPGVYNIAFSAQLLRTQGGSADTVSIWLRKNGTNEPNTNTDITLIANGQKQVAAWNFFVPVSCDPTCDTWQLMWSADGAFTNIWAQDEQANPARPAIPSIILTVNQVK